MPISRTVRPEPPCASEPPSVPPSVCASSRPPRTYLELAVEALNVAHSAPAILSVCPIPSRHAGPSIDDAAAHVNPAICAIWRSPPQIWRSPARWHFPVHRQSAQRLDRSESAEVQPLVRAASCCLSAAEPYHSGTLRTTKQRAHLQLQAGNVGFDPITISDPAAHASDGSGRISVRSTARLQPSHPHYPRTSGGTEY